MLILSSEPENLVLRFCKEVYVMALIMKLAKHTSLQEIVQECIDQIGIYIICICCASLVHLHIHLKARLHSHCTVWDSDEPEIEIML